MSRNDKCFCGSGLKIKKCHKNLNERSIIARMLSLYNKIDEILSENIEFKCKNNCCECCSDYFYISEEEFLVILNYMEDKFNMEEIQYIKEKSIQYMEYIKNNYNEEYKALNTVILEKNIKGNDKSLIKKLMPDSNIKIKCIYLSDGKCSIYKVRPIICRIYGTINLINSCKIVKRKKDTLNYAKFYKFIYEISINNKIGKILNKEIIEKKYPMAEFINDMYDYYILSGKYNIATRYTEDEFIKRKIEFYK